MWTVISYKRITGRLEQYSSMSFIYFLSNYLPGTSPVPLGSHYFVKVRCDTPRWQSGPGPFRSLSSRPTSRPSSDEESSTPKSLHVGNNSESSVLPSVPLRSERRRRREGEDDGKERRTRRITDSGWLRPSVPSGQLWKVFSVEGPRWPVPPLPVSYLDLPVSCRVWVEDSLTL